MGLVVRSGTMLASSSRTLTRRCEHCGHQLLARPLTGTARRYTSSDHFRTSNSTVPPPSDKPAQPLPRYSGPREGSSVSQRLDRWAKEFLLIQSGASENPKTFSWLSVSLFLATGAGLWIYFDFEKKRVKANLERERATRSVGKADIGGPFVMQTADGKPFTERNLLGQFHLIYFGFTNCPDVCPEELDKIGGVVDLIRKKHGKDSVRPIFVSVDPGRDTPKAMKRYLKDFHPDLIGLVGEYDAVKQMCKKYRVYFSTPPDTKPGDDYLVDHSIFFYLMSPEGQFVDAFGKVFTRDDVVEKVDFYLKEYKDGSRWGGGIQDIAT